VRRLRAFPAGSTYTRDAQLAMCWAVSCVLGFKGKPVGAKPIVVDVLKIEPGLRRVVDDHAALLKQSDLFLLGGSDLRERALHRAGCRKK